MKMQEIQEMARHIGIRVSGRTKSNLVREIQRKEGSFDCFGTARYFCDQDCCCFKSDCFKEAGKRNKENP